MTSKNEGGDSSRPNRGGLFGFLSSQRQSTQSAEDELKDFVAENDELLDDEKRMIHEILDLGDMDAGDIMTPRVDMILVEDTDTVRQAVDRMMGTGYSRLPVFHEDADRITGIVHYKDLVPPMLDGRGEDLVSDYAFEPLFVPESKDIFPLLTEMQTNRQQMAIVVDEYGGTDGLITIEDIVEEIVGEIVDETDRERPEIKQESDAAWLVSGKYPVEDAIELGWPLSESEDYETIAGWLLAVTDTVPKVGYVLERDGYRFTVNAMRRRRILEIRVECKEEAGRKATQAQGDDEESDRSESKAFSDGRDVGAVEGSARKDNE